MCSRYHSFQKNIIFKIGILTHKHSLVFFGGFHGMSIELQTERLNGLGGRKFLIGVVYCTTEC